MKFVHAFLWVVAFIGLTVVGDFVVLLSGIGVAVTRLAPRTPAYSSVTLTNVTTALSIVFATAVLLAVYAIRRPGAIGGRVHSFNERMRNPSVRDLILLWVVSPVTLYVPAIYATWHFYVARKARAGAATASPPLVARLAELDAARQAGLISADEHTTKRAQILEAY